MATATENEIAINELREEVRNSLGEIRLSIADLAERTNASGTLNDTTADELATLRARIDEVDAKTTGLDVAPVNDRVDALERDMIQLAERAPAPTPAGGSISEGAYETPRVGFENGLMQTVIETYYGSMIARYLNAPLIEADETEAA